MARSSAFTPDAAHYGDNVIDLGKHLNAPYRGLRPPHLIRNRIAALCAPYADAHVQTQGQVTCVRGSGPFGIDIGVCLREDACTLRLGGWHDEISDIDLALRYVAYAIDGRLRLEVACARHRPRKWTVECLDDNDIWMEEAFTCGVRMWWPRGESVVYLRNVFRPATAPCRRPPGSNSALQTGS